jgi:hypothetical protein
MGSTMKQTLAFCIIFIAAYGYGEPIDASSIQQPPEFEPIAPQCNYVVMSSMFGYDFIPTDACIRAKQNGAFVSLKFQCASEDSVSFYSYASGDCDESTQVSEQDITEQLDMFACDLSPCDYAYHCMYEGCGSESSPQMPPVTNFTVNLEAFPIPPELFAVLESLGLDANKVIADLIKIAIVGNLQNGVTPDPEKIASEIEQQLSSMSPEQLLAFIQESDVSAELSSLPMFAESFDALQSFLGIITGANSSEAALAARFDMTEEEVMALLQYYIASNATQAIFPQFAQFVAYIDYASDVADELPLDFVPEYEAIVAAAEAQGVPVNELNAIYLIFQQLAGMGGDGSFGDFNESEVNDTDSIDGNYYRRLAEIESDGDSEVDEQYVTDQDQQYYRSCEECAASLTELDIICKPMIVGQCHSLMVADQHFSAFIQCEDDAVAVSGDLYFPPTPMCGENPEQQYAVKMTMQLGEVAESDNHASECFGGAFHTIDCGVEPRNLDSSSTTSTTSTTSSTSTTSPTAGSQESSGWKINALFVLYFAAFFLLFI